MPPCAHIEYIETMCWPRGSSPLHYDEHAQCMCKGSFFPEWLGCQTCLLIHGLRTEREAAFYAAVLAGASESLCTGTPTLPFRSLFVEVEATAERITAGATDVVDLYPGNSDVDLYYTPSGPQGMGTVTGSAATVTMERGLATADPETTAMSKSSWPVSTNMRTNATDAPEETATPEQSRALKVGRTCLSSVAIAGCAIFVLV